MKSFDERAEATASDDNRNGGRPSAAELKAVRRVLRSRNRQLKDHLISLDTLLHLGGDLSQGPPIPGSSGNSRLAERFGRVAEELERIRKKLADVDFNAADKHDLKAALAEAAASWDARARLTRSSDAATITAALDAARKHDKAAAKHGKSVTSYFEDEG
jgi:hypothetical protein